MRGEGRDEMGPPADQYYGRQGAGHTPSIAFRHLPPNSASRYLRHLRGTLYLRAAVHRRSQRPPKGSGTNKAI